MYSHYQFISQGLTKAEQFNNIQKVLDKGIDWIQLRWKNQSEKDILLLAEEIKKLCELYHAVFIINDNVQIAKSIDANGVHLGLQDVDVASARQILGKDKIIGGTANTLQDVQQRINEQCNYIGLGPFRFTTTKNNLSPTLGLEGYRHIMQVVADKTTIPIYAIGGITQSDIADILDTGVYGIAASNMYLIGK